MDAVSDGQTSMRSILAEWHARAEPADKGPGSCELIGPR